VKISTRQLEGHLRKGMASLYTVHGAETLLALEAADRIREAARKDGCTEREVFFAEPGVDWNRIGASAANMSLFSSKRLVELRIPTGKPGAEGGKAIEAWCARLPEDAITLVVLPELEWQPEVGGTRPSSAPACWWRPGRLSGGCPVARRGSRQQQRASVERSNGSPTGSRKPARAGGGGEARAPASRRRDHARRVAIGHGRLASAHAARSNPRGRRRRMARVVASLPPRASRCRAAVALPRSCA
jgi:hypothetical protein